MHPRIHLALLLIAAPQFAAAQCVAFRPVPENSRCLSQSSAVEWTQPPAALSLASLPADSWDAPLADPALLQGVWVQGDQTFRLNYKGTAAVEILAAETAPKPTSFVLRANGKPLDTRHRVVPGRTRMRPGGGNRRFSLLGTVDGPAEIRVETRGQPWLLVAVRWSSKEDLELYQVNALRRQLARRLAEPFYGIGERGASLRATYLVQLGERLALSRNMAARREGLLAQARAFYWRASENHEPQEIALASGMIAELIRTAPDDERVRQMASAGCLGQNTGPGQARVEGSYCSGASPVEWTLALPPPPAGAPLWAVHQRAIQRRMETLTQWWVDQRQRENGELGGGWGDDVEILRQWGPQALGFGSAAAAKGIRRLADGLWLSGELENGYSRQVSDVEHSSEPSTDTLPLRFALDPGDPASLDRLRQTAECAHHWIGQAPDGYWRFRSSWFNCKERDERPERAVDVHLNTRAMGPALWYAYITRDAGIIQLLSRWGESWLRAMRQSLHGKPAGRFPPALAWADGSYLIRSQDWAKPQLEWDYFQWSERAQESLAALMGALHHLTGDGKWRQAEQEARAALPRSEEPAGEAVLEYLEKAGPPIVERLSRNFAMDTSEALWTDRIYYGLPAGYRRALFGGEAPRGDRYPEFAVTWGVPEGAAAQTVVARAVLNATPERIEIALYNFEAEAISLPVRFWRLKPGRYSITSDTQTAGESEVRKLPHALELQAPPRRETRVVIAFQGL